MSHYPACLVILIFIQLAIPSTLAFFTLAILIASVFARCQKPSKLAKPADSEESTSLESNTSLDVLEEQTLPSTTALEEISSLLKDDDSEPTNSLQDTEESKKPYSVQNLPDVETGSLNKDEEPKNPHSVQHRINLPGVDASDVSNLLSNLNLVVGGRQFVVSSVKIAPEIPLVVAQQTIENDLVNDDEWDFCEEDNDLEDWHLCDADNQKSALAQPIHFPPAKLIHEKSASIVHSGKCIGKIVYALGYTAIWGNT